METPVVEGAAEPVVHAQPVEVTESPVAVEEPAEPAAAHAPAAAANEPAGEVQATAEPAGKAPAGRETASRAGALPLPNLEADLTDPAAMMVTPTVLSIPGTIMLRFEQQRPRHASHTALVLDALRAHAAQLPDLVLERRPGPRPGDLFPYRDQPGAGEPLRPMPLRIRPTAGELRIMDALSGWVNDEISRRRPGGRKVSRSEVVAVALDAYLPQSTPKRTKV